MFRLKERKGVGVFERKGKVQVSLKVEKVRAGEVEWRKGAGVVDIGEKVQV